MRRMGQVIGIKLDKLEAYRGLHADVETNWPEVVAAAARQPHSQLHHLPAGRPAVRVV